MFRKINQTAILMGLFSMAPLLLHSKAQAQVPSATPSVQIIQVVPLNNNQPANSLRPPGVDFAVVWSAPSSQPVIEEQTVALEVGLSDGSKATGSSVVDRNLTTINIRLPKRAEFTTYKAKVTVKFKSDSSISATREFHLASGSTSVGPTPSGPRVRPTASASSTGSSSSAARSPAGGVPLALRIVSATLRGAACGSATDCLDVKWERTHPETTALKTYNLHAEVSFVTNLNAPGERVQRGEETRVGGASFPAGPENQRGLALSPPANSNPSLIKVTLEAEFRGLFTQTFEKQGSF